MSSEKKNKIASEEQQIRVENDQMGDQENVDDVVMFRVKTALRAGPKIPC
jgi:hypothetical protein